MGRADADPGFVSRPDDGHAVGPSTPSTEFALYRPPQAVVREIVFSPALESWDKAGSASQERLQRSVRHVRERIEPLVKAGQGPLSLGFVVGLPAADFASDGYDLDNYVLPIVRALGHIHCASVWAAKQEAPLREHAAALSVGPTVTMPTSELEGWSFVQGEVATTSGTWQATLMDGFAVGAWPAAEGPWRFTWPSW